MPGLRFDKITFEFSSAKTYGFQDEKNKAGIVVDSLHDPAPFQLENASMAEGDGRCAAWGVTKKGRYTEYLAGPRHRDLDLLAGRLYRHHTDIACLYYVKRVALIPLLEDYIAVSIGGPQGVVVNYVLFEPKLTHAASSVLEYTVQNIQYHKT